MLRNVRFFRHRHQFRLLLHLAVADNQQFKRLMHFRQRAQEQIQPFQGDNSAHKQQRMLIFVLFGIAEAGNIHRQQAKEDFPLRRAPVQQLFLRFGAAGNARIGMMDDDMPHELLHAPDVPLRMQCAVREVDEFPAMALAPEQCFQRGWVVLPRNHHIRVDARDFPRQVLRNMQVVHIPFALVLDDFGFQNRRLQEFALVNHPLPVVLIAIRVNDEKLVRLLMRLHIVEQIHPIRRRDIRNQKHFTHPASSASSSFGIASVSRDSIYQFMRSPSRSRTASSPCRGCTDGTAWFRAAESPPACSFSPAILEK